MPDYKNQHYVPRAHFKPFSLDSAGKAINIYLLHKDRPVWGAPITGQCARSYFYGEDGKLEKLLGRMEGAYGGLVSKLADESFRPDEQDQWLLRYFILLQFLRTAEQVTTSKTPRPNEVPPLCVAIGRPRAFAGAFADI